MTTAPVHSEHVLWDNLRTRRRMVEPRKGVDAAAFRWLTRLKHSRLGVKQLRAEAEVVVAEEKLWAEMSEEALDERIESLRPVFARRVHERDHVRAGFAAVREVAFRETGERPYPVQIMGAMGLFHGQIVEMVTGEGKTLTASLAAAMLGWLRRPVHVITVNDYLAQRDADGRQPIYRRCGLRASAVLNETAGAERSDAYRQPITYTTQKELVADWLRDQLRLGHISDPVSTRWMATGNAAAGLTNVLVPGLHVAIVDEADAVLIDEAVTPLIIAQPRSEDAQAALYQRARELATALDFNKHYTVELAKRRIRLNPAGRAQVASMLNPEEHGIWRAARRREELVEQALVAEYCYQRGEHYQVVEDRIVIVDEYTGRYMEDRQWEHGLHQAVEAKHEIQVTADRDTLASMSFQRFFRQYKHLCGMTGTAADAKAELETTYGLPVRVIPTNRPLRRSRFKDRVYTTSEQKWRAIIEQITEMHREGRPVLIGTRCIEASEMLSEMLRLAGLPHQVLNAVHHKAEAQIIADAGERGAVTVATNMAGRGTDIKLAPGVDKMGGLHVLLTEFHRASRIDRQFVGRSGRQGDPGSAQVMVSLEDDLVLKHAPRMAAVLRRRFARHPGPLPMWTRRVFMMAQAATQRQAFKGRYSVMRRDEELDQHLPR